MKKDWTETLRDRLSESAVTPPEGLWTDISSDLDAAMLNVKRPRRLGVWRWVAAAACLAAIVVCGVWIANSPSLSDKPMDMTAESEPTHMDTENAANEIGSNVKPKVLASVDSKGGTTGQGWSSPPQAVDGNEVTVDNEITDGDGQGDDGPPPSHLTTVDPEGDGPTENDHVPSRLNTANQEGDVTSAGWPSTKPVDNVKTGSLRNSIALSVFAANPDLPTIDLRGKDWAGGNLTSSAPQDPDNSDPNNPSATTPGDNPSVPGTPTAPPTVKAKHHQPVRYGLSIRLPFSQKLSVATGVAYSRLASEITVISPSYSSIQQIDQTLHYIGVPVSVDYALPSVGPVSLYLTGGVMAERCVYGEAKSQMNTEPARVSEQGLQLSVFAGAGVQFNLSDHVSLYAEPLATYYIDNHSSLTSVYKDRPLSLDLRMGLRYTLK